MPLGAKKKSALESRLKEIAKEQSSINDDIKSTQRVVKKATRNNNKTTTGGIGSFRNKVGALRSKIVNPKQGLEHNESGQDLNKDLAHFKHGDVDHSFEEGTNKSKRRMDDRFAAYLTSGGFVPGKIPRRTSSRIMRNRIIFFAVLFILIAIIISQLIRIF